MQDKWMKIVSNIDGFHKTIPRRFSSDSEEQNLAIFADASEVAIAACGYIFTRTSSSLVIAKSKLPSIKTKTTMPKLEMNALTLATRLALSISQAVKKKAPGYPWKVYIFSDSQIVLNWLSSTRCTNLGVLVSNRLQEMRRIRYGSFSTVKRITALVLRFLKHLMRSFSNARKKAIFERIPELNDIALNSDPLNGQEMRAARFALIRNHQLIHLTSHYRKSMENTLRLYKDTHGIWRSRGRIGRSTLDDSAKN
ncbi:unnamed protein product, partial [Heligmosomoides polygyrus]|uniref:RNase H domain-containing protein n=1 Tax=Heligmosomoides polygyrus TaxID=6339 RepID=A0A183FLG5_HELPZ